MKTIRQLIEDFTYEHLERFISMVAEGGEDTEFRGIRVLDDPERFVYGALVNTTATLYLHYLEKGDGRAERTLGFLRSFVASAAKTPLKTWGKLSMLKALAKLYRAGKMELLGEDVISVLRVKTDYVDFFDKETMTLKGYPTNYMQVAMACAGYRELIGFDTEPFCERIRDRLAEIMASSDSGYMDEDLPHGRFDRYSLIVSSEFADTMDEVGKAVPVSVLSNLSDAAGVCIAMANERGDGINYGRSLSCHGDAAALEILSSALRLGLVAKEDLDTALLYSIRITEKVLSFWYDEKLGSYNIWWEGRSTNAYRGQRRVLEVNLDMANHMLCTLANFEKAGLADTLPSIESLPCPEDWTAYEVKFSESAEKVCTTVVLRRKDLLAMLPLIGIGNRYTDSSYQPFPAILGVLEAAPEAKYPFFVPEYTDGTDTYRPIEFYDSVQVCEAEGGVTVEAEGFLAKMGGKNPEKTLMRFKSVYTFFGDEIGAEFTALGELPRASMLVGAHGGGLDCTVLGYTSESSVETENLPEFCTPSGAIREAKLYTFDDPCRIGYRVKVK